MIRHFKPLVFSAILAITLSLGAETKGNADEGKKIYEANNCGSCHNLDKKVVGPALRGVGKRRDIAWLTKWIRNNQALIKSGDADANALLKEYGGAQMSTFENITPAQVVDLVAYLDLPKPPPTGGAKKPGVPEPPKSDNTLYILLALIGIFLVLLLILNKVKNTLRKLNAEAAGEELASSNKNWLQRLLPARLANMNQVVLALFSFAIVVILGGGYLYSFGITEVGVQKGYAPKQPIAYSHKLHAGDLKIDCKYCHIGVEESKSATIPSANICMNCHKGIQKRQDDESGVDISPEIQKIYTALDYHPEKSGAEQFGSNGKPIQWIRIHNLPDHAYFNHSQHVKVGKLQCQTCHGPIEKMEVVQQWSTLQMGWCIECHRNTGIDVANNNYYLALHEKASKDMKENKSRSKYFGPDGKVKVTVALNGGLECSKCHY
ncbi:MAG: c-type cytochrome [Bacteroidetes bacterium]|nr:c-type cytochrome [Bacteroidota bacterium]